MKEENANPALVPFDDRNPHPERLYRTPSEMTDEQFTLLAAAWAEGDIDDESLSDIETLFKADANRKAYAEGFKVIRLKAPDDRWDGKKKMIHTSPFAIKTRRALAISLAAAATIAVFLAFRVLLFRQVTDVTVPSPAYYEIASAQPLYKSPSLKPAQQVKTILNETGRTAMAEVVTESRTVILYDAPLAIASLPQTVYISQQADPLILKVNDIVSSGALNFDPVTDQNWIIRGINAIASTVFREEKTLDGYVIAGACVKGVNSVLGWDMQLEQVVSKDGDPVAVSFSSSLLSFRSPVKKTAPLE